MDFDWFKRAANMSAGTKPIIPGIVFTSVPKAHKCEGVVKNEPFALV